VNSNRPNTFVFIFLAYSHLVVTTQGYLFLAEQNSQLQQSVHSLTARFANCNQHSIQQLLSRAPPFKACQPPIPSDPRRTNRTRPQEASGNFIKQQSRYYPPCSSNDSSYGLQPNSELSLSANHLAGSPTRSRTEALLKLGVIEESN